MSRVRANALMGATVLIALATGCETDLLDLPAPPDPEAQARIIATRYIGGGYPNVIDHSSDGQYAIYRWKYTQGVTLWALLLLHEQTGDAAYLGQVRASFENYDAHGRIRVDGDSEPIDYIGAMAHAILEYSLRSGDHRFLDDALEAARFFRDDVARTPEGLIAYHSDPERGRIWADALFMVAPLMAKAGRYLGDESYYDDVLEQFRGFAERLRDPATGLYHQGWNWHGSGASPGFWGRANGWVIVAMVEVLDAIPAGYAGRDELLVAYQDFARAIADHQGIGGMWHQLLDHPESYEETSCTGMFIYALARGVERGWLDASSVDVVETGHAGLSRMISLGGDIDNICPGMSTQSSEDDYLGRDPRRNDSHGIGPALLGAYGAMMLGEPVE
jgi:unsaturated rhamnogalacturonyl hydrolase